MIWIYATIVIAHVIIFIHCIVRVFILKKSLPMRMFLTLVVWDIAIIIVFAGIAMYNHIFKLEHDQQIGITLYTDTTDNIAQDYTDRYLRKHFISAMCVRDSFGEKTDYNVIGVLLNGDFVIIKLKCSKYGCNVEDMYQ